MAKLIYDSEDSMNREASRIEMNLPHDIDIIEYKTICNRMAAAMRFGPNSISNTFDVNTKTHRTSVIDTNGDYVI